RLVQAPPERARRPRGGRRHRRRLRQVPRRRPAQPRRHHRHLHRLPHAAHLLRRDRPPAHHLRPLPPAPPPPPPRTLPHGPAPPKPEIYTESKHGALSEAQHPLLNLKAEPKKLTTKDMFVPTCATCHMSGLNGLNVTHDPSERLSYLLAAEISPKRPNFHR